MKVIFIIQHTTLLGQIVCTVLLRWFKKSPIGRDWFSTIKTGSAVRFTHSRAETEQLMSINYVSFKNNVFSSRLKNWKII
jgi:hypothetical protein